MIGSSGRRDEGRDVQAYLWGRTKVDGYFDDGKIVWRICLNRWKKCGLRCEGCSEFAASNTLGMEQNMTSVRNHL